MEEKASCCRGPGSESLGSGSESLGSWLGVTRVLARSHSGLNALESESLLKAKAAFH